MKVQRIFVLLLCILLVSGLTMPTASALDAPDVTSGAALLVDVNNDTVLFQKNAGAKMYPASLTKVMTALLTLEAVDAGQLSLDQVITASNTFTAGLSSNGSTQGIRAGEQMSVRDLLYCLLVPSANEAANILAESVDGSISAFVERMNRRAQELGCQGTHFDNPHGLHNDNHYTTAHDLYLIARKAMENETFRTIVSTRRYEVPATNMHSARLFYNTNALLVTWYYRDTYIYNKAIGIKTGTTTEGGNCLLSAAKDADDYLICVVLKADIVRDNAGSVTDRRHFSESRALFQWGFSNFERRQVVDTQTPVAQVNVTLSKIDHVLVRPAAELMCTLPIDVKSAEIKQEIVLHSDTVAAPIAEGQVLGTMKLHLGDQELGSVDLVAVTGAERSQSLYRLHQIRTFFSHSWARLLIAAVILVIAILLLRFTLFRPRHRRYNSPYRRPPRRR